MANWAEIDLMPYHCVFCRGAVVIDGDCLRCACMTVGIDEPIPGNWIDTSEGEEN